jgi:uncharacterized membrane protein
MSNSAANALDAGVSAFSASARESSIDLMRGLIIVLMALDHVRIFFTAASFDPLDLTQTSPGLFFTRWVTHLCAPGFFALAGLSVWLQQLRGAPRLHLAKWLVIRGLWLIALELTVLGIAWSFTVNWRWLGVIWGLGAGMLLLAASLTIPMRVLLVLSLGFVALHSLLLPLSGLTLPVALYAPGIVDVPVLGQMLVIYPVLPWAAMMALGYAAGPWLYPQGTPAQSKLLLAGMVALVGFIALRASGLGDANVQVVAVPSWRSIASFVDVDKYPPSSLYALLMLGIECLLLAVFASRIGNSKALHWLRTFGRVPFFFYLLHLFAIHGLAWMLAQVLHWPHAHLFWHEPDPKMMPAPGYGLDLPGIYITWTAVLVLLYPLCAAFAHYKRTRSAWWLRLL